MDKRQNFPNSGDGNIIVNTLRRWLADHAREKATRNIPTDAYEALLDWAVGRLREKIPFSRVSPRHAEGADDGGHESPDLPWMPVYAPAVFDRIADPTLGDPPTGSDSEERAKFYKQFYADFYFTLAEQFFEDRIFPDKSESDDGLPLRNDFVDQIKVCHGDASLRTRLKQRIDWWIGDVCRKKNESSDYGRLGMRIHKVLSADPQTFKNIRKANNWWDSIWILNHGTPTTMTQGDRLYVFRKRCEDVAPTTLAKITEKTVRPMVIDILKAVGEPAAVAELQEMISEKTGILRDEPPLSIAEDATHDEEAVDFAGSSVIPESDMPADCLVDQPQTPTLQICAADFIRMTGLHRDREFFAAALRLIQSGLTHKKELIQKLMATEKMGESTVYVKVKKLDALFEFIWRDKADRRNFVDEMIRQLEPGTEFPFIREGGPDEQR